MFRHIRETENKLNTDYFCLFQSTFRYFQGTYTSVLIYQET